jgi:hypothetical protein
MKNIRSIERPVRFALGLLAVEAGFFWLAGPAQWAAYAAGAVLALTALIGFCPLYRLLGIGRSLPPAGRSGVLARYVLPAALVLALAAAAYASAFATRKFFLEEFNAMNNEYKQTLLFTGKNEPGPAATHAERLAQLYGGFQDKYAAYRPPALRGDAQFGPDLARVAAILAAGRAELAAGELPRAHLTFEQARPLLQGMLKRNDFSLLAVALVDFHDPMELLLAAAAAKDSARIVALHPQVSEAFKAVEQQAGDPEIAAIRSNLDGLLALALAGNANALPAKADELKRSFVKVYLARG